MDTFIRNGTDKETIAKLIDSFFNEEGFAVEKLPDDDFKGLLYGLSRVFSARVMNCVDALGRYDREWSRLSCLLKEAFRKLGGIVEEDKIWNMIAEAIGKTLAAPIKNDNEREPI